MVKTAKNNKHMNNKTKKNIKYINSNENNCSKIGFNNYKTCKSKMYKSVYGGRYLHNSFF